MGEMKKKRDRASALLSAPLIAWTLLFVGATIGYVIVLSFLKRKPDGFGVLPEFTLENYAKLFSANYGRIFLNTLKLGVETTALCMLLGYPFGYLMGRASKKWRTILMLLVIVPFWTNALIRVPKVTKLGDLPACVGVLKSLISNKPELGDALQHSGCSFSALPSTRMGSKA